MLKMFNQVLNVYSGRFALYICVMHCNLAQVCSNQSLLLPSITMTSRLFMNQRCLCIAPERAISFSRNLILEAAPTLCLLSLLSDLRNCSDCALWLSAEMFGEVPEIAKDYDAATQQCFSLLLALTSRIPIDNYSIREKGTWQTGLGIQLGGKTYGCVGLGRLGAKAARTSILGFGMKVIAWSANLTQGKADEQASAMGLAKGAIKAVSKEELLKTADVVGVHYILSDRSRGLIGKGDLDVMKKSALLVNTSRGPIVDERALLDALENGKIRGAGLDVFDIEPLPKDSLWRTTRWGEGGRSDVVLSPHMGYNIEETMQRFYAEQADTIDKWIKGEELPDVMA